MTPENISRSSKNAPTAEEVALRAHQIWLEQGCPQGHDVPNWLEAERQLAERYDRSTLETNKIPEAEDVNTSEVTRPDSPYSALRGNAPLASRVEEEVVRPGKPTSRRSKTSLDL